VTETEMETVTESETETVTESETVTGFTRSRRSSRTPDSGPRPPDSGPPGPRTESDTDTGTGICGQSAPFGGCNPHEGRPVQIHNPRRFEGSMRGVPI